jgi:cellulose synthase/poly-beta-1,6-N-acetylglucosamine synthase-like glycosyltransferase
MRRLHFQRAVGLVILGLATAGALGLWLGVARQEVDTEAVARDGLFLGIWRVVYDSGPPSARVMLIAGSIALLFAAGVAWLENRAMTRDRRSDDERRMPLAPRVVMASNRGRFDGPVTVTVLIPAHNEEDRLGPTLIALMAQDPQPDRVIVVADNCTDGTVEVARRAGVDVVETLANSEKKAGALNQVLRWLLPRHGDNDLVMVLDADTVVERGFLAQAIRLFVDDRALMAVGGCFYGEPGYGLVGAFQRHEYLRYSRDIRRRRGRTFVLTGTASLFRPAVLRRVAEERGHALPGRQGDVYDIAALTEDNELTLAVRSLGGLMVSPAGCRVVTEVMPSWRTLWTQRLRWQRGALENLAEYGLTPQTFRYWAQQVGIGYGVIAFASFLLLMLVLAIRADTFIWYPFWLGIGGLFAVERVVTVWSLGWRARLLALLLIPELCYAVFLNAVYVNGVLDIARGRRAQWGGRTALAPVTGGEVA